MRTMDVVNCADAILGCLRVEGGVELVPTGPSVRPAGCMLPSGKSGSESMDKV